MKEVLFNKIQRLKEETKYLVDNKPKFLRDIQNHPLTVIRSTSLETMTSYPKGSQIDSYILLGSEISWPMIIR